MESGILLKESVISPAIRIQNPSSSDKGSGIQYVKSGIHGVEFRLLDSLTAWGDFTIAALFGSLEQATRMIR